MGFLKMVCFIKKMGIMFLLGTMMMASTLTLAADYPRHYLKTTIPAYPRSECDSFLVYGLTKMYEDVGLIRYIVKKFSTIIEDLNPDYIAAPEARGWPAAGAVSYETGKPMIAIRKPGKLPRMASLLDESYSTAYSDDKIEMIADPSYVGKTVVIIDDGLSSGGTTMATIKLLEKAGMRVIHILVVVEYHYRAEGTIPEFKPWISRTTTLFDLGEPPVVIQ